MRLQVGKCYKLTSDGFPREFRVMKNIDNKVLIRYCNTGKEEEFYTETTTGGFSVDYTVDEIDCLECDGAPSVPSI